MFAVSGTGPNGAATPTADNFDALIESMSLETILHALDLFDEGALPLTEQQSRALATRLLTKVDGIKEKIDQWKKEAERLRGYAVDFETAAGTFDKEIGRLEDYVRRAMRSRDMMELPGEKFKIKLKHTQVFKVLQQPTAFEAHHEALKEFVRVTPEKTVVHPESYAWEANAIKAALKSKRIAEFNYGVVVDNYKVEIDVNKRGK